MVSLSLRHSHVLSAFSHTLVRVLFVFFLTKGFSLVRFCYHERHQEEDSMQQEAWRIFERAKGTAVHHQKMRGHAHLLE
ncbi:hypothetical protein Bca4012_101173 [Brassica carinata]